VSPQLEEFINRMVNSPVKLELLLFLHNNQFTLDTALAISRRVGKDAEDVARALEELSRWNVVARQDTGGEPAYGYTQDGHVVKRIEQLAAEYLGENQYEVLSKVYAAQASRQTSQLLELRQRDSLKMQFLSLVSHELRTPLTTIKAAADTMARMDAELDADQRAEWLRQIGEQAEKLMLVVNDLLTVSQKSQAGDNASERQTPLNLREVVERAVSCWNERLDMHSVELQLNGRELREFDAVPLVTGDESCVAIILDKLIDNAAKFFPDGGSIVISLAEKEDEVEIAVKDSGIGIATDQIEKVFDEFYQVEYYSTRRAGGCGLGLPIAKRLTESMGGRISIQSRLGEGTVTSVFLKKSPECGQDAHARGSAEA